MAASSASLLAVIAVSLCKALEESIAIGCNSEADAEQFALNKTCLRLKKFKMQLDELRSKIDIYNHNKGGSGEYVYSLWFSCIYKRQTDMQSSQFSNS